MRKVFNMSAKISSALEKFPTNRLKFSLDKKSFPKDQKGSHVSAKIPFPIPSRSSPQIDSCLLFFFWMGISMEKVSQQRPIHRYKVVTTAFSRKFSSKFDIFHEKKLLYFGCFIAKTKVNIHQKFRKRSFSSFFSQSFERFFYYNLGHEKVIHSLMLRPDENIFAKVWYFWDFRGEQNFAFQSQYCGNIFAEI